MESIEDLGGCQRPCRGVRDLGGVAGGAAAGRAGDRGAQRAVLDRARAVSSDVAAVECGDHAEHTGWGEGHVNDILARRGAKSA